MFKNLSTGAKLGLLCAMFIASILVTTYALVSEKQIAIAFARKELVGTTYLTAVRNVFANVKPDLPSNSSAGTKQADELLQQLAAAQAGVGGTLQTGDLARALSDTLRLWQVNRDSATGDRYAMNAVAEARRLAARVADGSNLALDPDLDSYHVQDLITRKLPTFLRQLSELQASLRTAATAPAASEQKAGIQIIAGLLQASAQEVRDSLAAAYHGNPDGSLKQTIDGRFAAMISDTDAYLKALNEQLFGSNVSAPATYDPVHRYRNLHNSVIAAWTIAQDELNRLLNARIAGLTTKMLVSLALIGALVVLSIMVAFMTHRHIVRPLVRLENVASTVRKTQDYSLRADRGNRDEIGRLAGAFNDMLAELAAARDRERVKQTEFMRISRLTTMGTMTASIAHEINQPLAAIVANGNASLRLLALAPPNFDEARAALDSIVKDGLRAGDIIAGIRAIFRRDEEKRVPLDINELIREVLRLMQGEFQNERISVRAELGNDLPSVLGNRVQLQLVLRNLITNAVEAMSSVTDRGREVHVQTEAKSVSVRIAVRDSGAGIDRESLDRIFNTFFTTKAHGMGMGLSICRSIVEAHGGQLSASRSHPHGSVFAVVLPVTEQGKQ
jgi:signal transduction histidine kinase